MKAHAFFVIILTLFSCQQVREKATYLTDNISVIFPDSLVEKRQDKNFTLYYIMNDSVEYVASVLESETITHADSVNKIEGIDANVYRLAETQDGVNIKTSEVIVESTPAISFQYECHSSNLREDSNFEGVVVYYKKHMIFLQFVNRMDLREELSDEKDAFLNSLRIE